MILSAPGRAPIYLSVQSNSINPFDRFITPSYPEHPGSFAARGGNIEERK
jgi:hypothetical protein